jgi:hypothetical protein
MSANIEQLAASASVNQLRKQRSDLVDAGQADGRRRRIRRARTQLPRARPVGQAQRRHRPSGTWPSASRIDDERCRRRSRLHAPVTAVVSASTVWNGGRLHPQGRQRPDGTVGSVPRPTEGSSHCRRPWNVAQICSRPGPVPTLVPISFVRQLREHLIDTSAYPPDQRHGDRHVLRRGPAGAQDHRPPRFRGPGWTKPTRHPGQRPHVRIRHAGGLQVRQPAAAVLVSSSQDEAVNVIEYLARATGQAIGNLSGAALRDRRPEPTSPAGSSRQLRAGQGTAAVCHLRLPTT